MNRLSIRPMSASHQQGFALIVAILLLLILTVFSLFATNVGVFEQRTSANEYRAKAIAQVADAALNHGAESLRTLDKTIGPKGGKLPNVAFWELCDAADESFPCGAERNGDRRKLTYRYKGGVDLNGDGSTSLYEQRSINFPTIVGESTRLLVDSVASSDPTNPFPVEYQVGLLLCRVDSTTVAAGTAGCTTDESKATENRAYTLVARASMIGEQSSATFTKTVVPIENVTLNPKVPSIVASGVMRGVGNATVVPNPNSGGFGVPISFWSRDNFKSENGSWQTCHYDDWVRSDTVIYQGISVCAGNSCGCPKDAYLSCGGPNCDADSGTGNEGIDVLDVDNDVGVLNDTEEFPRDLMEFLWGPIAQARDVDSDGDGWNETASVVIPDTDPDTYLRGQSRRAITFLQNAGFKRLTCTEATAELDKTASGKYWVELPSKASPDKPCVIPSQDIGSPDGPVQLVMDGGIDLSSKTRLFGIAFGRDISVKVASAGGSAKYSPGGGGAEVYGALVVEGPDTDGQPGNANAQIMIVYDAKTLTGGDKEFNPNVAAVPGSWSDHRVSY